jgi:hypothetical protein
VTQGQVEKKYEKIPHFRIGLLGKILEISKKEGGKKTP